MVATQASNTKYAEGLAADNNKHQNKLGKTIKLLEGMATGRSINERELPSLITNIDKLKKQTNMYQMSIVLNAYAKPVDLL